MNIMSKYHFKTIRDALAVIISVIFLILVFQKGCQGQVYGFNGTNVPENLTPEVRSWVLDMHPDTLVMVFRNDKYTTAAPVSDVNNVISLANEAEAQGKHLQLIYTFSVKPDVSLQDNFSAFNTFLNSGVDIMAARLGNETYFKAAGFNADWNTYWASASVVRDALLSYNLPIIIPIATPENTKWNNPAAALINSSSIYGVDFHFYWGRNDISIYRDTNYVKNDALIKRSNAVGYAAFYESVYSEITNSTLLPDVMAWFYDTFPNKKMYITEWGAGGNPGGMGGTIGFEAANDWFLNQISGYLGIAAICKFNGASITGYITPTGKLDILTEPYIKRLGYYTLYNFYQSRDSLTLGLKESVHNFTSDTLFLNRKGYTATFTGLSGNWDASSGACAWWASNSVKSYEITGLNTYNFVPPMSYGYVTYEPIKGCTDPAAVNYNPDAVENDLSCLYIKECYRKRWLFSSLGCKPVKTNCNCK